MQGLGKKTPAERGVRCVVLTAAHAPAGAPADLTEALRRRGIQPVMAAGAYAAVAAMSEAKAAGGGDLALVVVEPARALPAGMLDRLLGTLERHIGEVALWTYDEASSPRLRAMERRRAATRHDASEEERVRRARPKSPPALRLTPGWPEEHGLDETNLLRSGPVDESTPPRAPSPADMLTEQELSMLLADGPGGVWGRT